MQELERGDSGIRSFASVQGALVMYPIFAYGSDEQKRHWLPRLAAGRRSAASGDRAGLRLQPGGAGHHARETKDGWVLNGTKMWITNGSQATVAIIWAKTGALDDPSSIRGFIVPASTRGYAGKDQKGKLSLRASDTSEIHLQDVCLPKDAILPKSGGLRARSAASPRRATGSRGGRRRGNGVL